MGDFNINLEADSLEKRELLDIFDIFSLSMIPMAFTHHQPHCEVTLNHAVWLSSHTMILLVFRLRLIIYVSR
jgi:hypothetical protein